MILRIFIFRWVCPYPLHRIDSYYKKGTQLTNGPVQVSHLDILKQKTRRDNCCFWKWCKLTLENMTLSKAKYFTPSNAIILKSKHDSFVVSRNLLFHISCCYLISYYWISVRVGKKICLLSMQLFPLDFVIDNFLFYYFSGTKYSVASQLQHVFPFSLQFFWSLPHHLSAVSTPSFTNFTTNRAGSHPSLMGLCPLQEWWESYWHLWEVLYFLKLLIPSVCSYKTCEGGTHFLIDWGCTANLLEPWCWPYITLKIQTRSRKI